MERCSSTFQFLLSTQNFQYRSLGVSCVTSGFVYAAGFSHDGRVHLWIKVALKMQ